MRFITTIFLYTLSVFLLSAQDTLPDGHTQFFYGNGQVSSEGMIKDGKADGLWTTYYVKGTIKSIGKRNNFLLDSVWLFYDEQGHLSEEINYLRGKKSGYHIKYQRIIIQDSLVNSVLSRELFLDNRREGLGYYYGSEGGIDQIIRYKAGLKHGYTREFTEDSIINILYKYHNDFLIDREFINQRDSQGRKQGLWKTIYNNDNIREEINYKDDILHGYYREYNERGQLLVARFYENGEVVQREEAGDIQVEVRNQFDDEGNMIGSGGYIGDTPVGTHREYTDNQSVIKTKEYSNSGQLVADGVTDEKGQKDEFWQFFFPGGNLRSEGNFKDNLRDGTWKFYYPTGELEQTGQYRLGAEDGLWTWYFLDGSVRREENYYRGEEDGLSVEYDESGRVIAQGEYIEGLKEGEWFYHVGDHTEKGFYRGDERDGLWQHYYLDNQKKFSGSFVQGFANGKHRFYFQNGKIKEDRYFEMGRKERTWRNYDSEGNVLLSTSYSDDLLSKINGVRVNLEK